MKNITIRFPADIHRELSILKIDGKIESIQDYVIKLIKKELKKG